MRVAILGAGGFIGYAFVREALRRGMTPVACWGSPGSLVLLARHRMELRPVENLDLSDVDVVVNCAHPFTVRGNRSLEAQTRTLRDNLLASGRPLIHLSTISVYEPFSAGLRPGEDLACSPPASDQYAQSKLRLDRELQQRAGERTLILRPTIVYGPFGRYWTDAFLAAFRAGDVSVPDAGGRVQPVLVDDLARLMADACEHFRPGLYNVGGPEELEWRALFRFWSEVAGGGSFHETGPRPPTRPQRFSELRELARILLDAPPLRRLARPLVQRIPDSLRARFRRALGRPDRPLLVPIAPLPGEAPQVPALPPDLRGLAESGYFSQDRLVDLSRLRADFPGLRPTPLEETRARLGEYCSFRFTDTLPT